jgi:hypothetical protein
MNIITASAKDVVGCSTFTAVAQVGPSEKRQISTSGATIQMQDLSPDEKAPDHSAFEAACYSGVAYATRVFKNSSVCLKVLSVSGRCSASQAEGIAVVCLYIVAIHMGKLDFIPEDVLSKYQLLSYGVSE